MPIHYDVRAEVVDITSDTPQKKDKFLVDTNVWYWLTYTRAGQTTRPPVHYQITHYPAYTYTALNAGSVLYQSGLSHAELTHLVEKAERDIYQALHGHIRTKEYRHNIPRERTRVVSEVAAACGQVNKLGIPLKLTIDPPTVEACLSRLQTQRLDGYDLFILESMQKNNVTQVITDDGDFVTVDGIQVFTANRNVIHAARTQGKLVSR